MRAGGAVLLLAWAALCEERGAETDQLKSGQSALRRGEHQTAFDVFKTVYRSYSNPEDAWAHPELQEGLCVCAAKLKKELSLIHI